MVAREHPERRVDPLVDPHRRIAVLGRVRVEDHDVARVDDEVRLGDLVQVVGQPFGGAVPDTAEV
jgi:hypothetical protein